MTDHGDDIPEPGRRSRLAELADWTVAGAREDDTPPASERTPAETQADQLSLARREFARLLGEFRRTAVLVPFDAYGSLWTADQNGVRWICAFSDEEALARFALAQGDGAREWTYRTILGALLSSAVAVEPDRDCRESELNALSELTASGLVEAEDLAPLRELRRDLLTEPDAEHYDYLVGEYF
ncbi:hypothetical protein [Streptomyces cyaneofuscatus]|uniref:hypothetical protein n=1 Tax=Streptomyces cyaneofuscatus TaxID=66883 RepID=UPI0036D808C4